MAFKVLAGPYLNHLTRAVTAPTMSPSALSTFPVTNAYDNRSSKAAIFGSAADDSTLTGDLNLIQGDFETSGEAATWTMLGVGTLASNGSDDYSGSASGLLTIAGGGATDAIAYRDVTVRAGEELNLFGAAKKGTATNVYIRLRNRQTGNWLKGSDQTWNASSQNVLSVAGSGWETVSGTTAPITFTVESLELCQADTVTLRIYLWIAGASGHTGRFDALELWPSLNWCSVHGHNIPPFIVPTLQRSDDNSSWTTEQTITLRRDSFYVALSGLESHRYWRLLLDGRPDTASLMHMGEVVMGQSFDLIRNPRFGGSLGWVEKQTRLASDLGEEFVHRHNVKAPQRRLVLPFGFATDEEYEQHRDSIFRGSRGGSNMICIAPVEMDSSVVILGRIREESVIDKSGPYPRSGELELIESPLPSVPDIVHAYDAPIESGG